MHTFFPGISLSLPSSLPQVLSLSLSLSEGRWIGEPFPWGLDIGKCVGGHDASRKCRREGRQRHGGGIHPCVLEEIKAWRRYIPPREDADKRQ